MGNDTVVDATFQFSLRSLLYGVLFIGVMGILNLHVFCGKMEAFVFFVVIADVAVAFIILRFGLQLVISYRQNHCCGVVVHRMQRSAKRNRHHEQRLVRRNVLRRGRDV